MLISRSLADTMLDQVSDYHHYAHVGGVTLHHSGLLAGRQCDT